MKFFLIKLGSCVAQLCKPSFFESIKLVEFVFLHDVMIYDRHWLQILRKLEEQQLSHICFFLSWMSFSLNSIFDSSSHNTDRFPLQNTSQVWETHSRWIGMWVEFIVHVIWSSRCKSFDTESVINDAIFCHSDDTLIFPMASHFSIVLSVL